MSALLIAEHNNKEVKPFTLNAITAASQIDKDLHVLVIGNKTDIKLPLPHFLIFVLILQH